MLALNVCYSGWYAFFRFVLFALLLKHRDLHDFVVGVHVVFIKRYKLFELFSFLAPLVLGYVDYVPDKPRACVAACRRWKQELIPLHLEII
jgi:hypothetical protein